MSDRPRFFADAMLGTLARWLRILGLDVEYESDIADADLVERALAEGRIILTRDRRLVERRRARRHLLIDSDAVHEQLRQVIDELEIDLPPDRLLGRCLDCNAPLEPIPAAAARPHVPPFVARTQESFRRCPSCERIFWRATHVDAIEERLGALGIDLEESS